MFFEDYPVSYWQIQTYPDMSRFKASILYSHWLADKTEGPIGSMGLVYLLFTYVYHEDQRHSCRIHISPMDPSWVSLPKKILLNDFVEMTFLMLAEKPPGTKSESVSTDWAELLGTLRPLLFRRNRRVPRKGTLHRFHRWDWCHWTSARWEPRTIG